MWLFLVTEILLFGGLFCAYAVYRANHPEIFVYAPPVPRQDPGRAQHGGPDLLAASRWPGRCARPSSASSRLLTLLLGVTLLCAFGFLGVKYVEYTHKWHARAAVGAQLRAPDPPRRGRSRRRGGREHDGGGDGHDRAGSGLGPAGAGPVADPDRSTIPPAATGPAGLAVEAAGGAEEIVVEPKNAQTFFSIYFLMTGLHGIHVLGGIGAMFWLLACAGRGDFDTGHFTPVDMVALYWHVVDLIWIYLFLLLYLIH